MGELGQYFDGGGINPDDVEPMPDFEPMPPGNYPVEIDKAEIRDTKDKKGKKLWMEMTVIGEQYSGRKLFPTINIINPSVKCTEFGRREIAQLARACGIPFLDDENKLLGKQLMVRVKIKHDKGYDPDNEVKDYKPLDGQAAAAPEQKAAGTSPPTQQAPAAPTSGQTKMPWER